MVFYSQICISQMHKKNNIDIKNQTIKRHCLFFDEEEY